MEPHPNADEREGDSTVRGDTRSSLWRRAKARIVKALSDLMEASEPKRRRPRNLYIKGMTSRGLATRPYGE
jgi:hypothetical protein